MTDKPNQDQHLNIIDEIEHEADQDLHPLLKKILDNLKPIGLGLGALILLVGAYSGYTTYTGIQANKLTNALGTILLEQDPAKRITSLNQFLQEHPSALSVGPLLELANTAMTSKDYTTAASAWARVADKTEGDIHILASMGQARALSLDGKYKEALTILEAIDTVSAKDFATPLARQIAFVAEQNGDWEKALAAYQELKAAGAVTNTAFLDMKIADIKAKMS
ncbi:tetratricopeptide repeat protein [Desulfoplanes formicivorans]|uniref:Ancillary SecYEG translocon subunit/Cell division coordinator CpoB TPR domain-containing protein n=1 Tax=Desulfoplanes formicivorans TaxID=1592317 RepID=A0A194AC17_9BACT|nr:tetratricopeptide repeat protein [Desulfoplanes formicivorans]GAU07692.1 hypothetical protein DPF_0387 [Desulfoplanes formicivorans]